MKEGRKERETTFGWVYYMSKNRPGSLTAHYFIYSHQNPLRKVLVVLHFRDERTLEDYTT